MSESGNNDIDISLLPDVSQGEPVPDNVVTEEIIDTTDTNFDEPLPEGEPFIE